MLKLGKRGWDSRKAPDFSVSMSGVIVEHTMHGFPGWDLSFDPI
jgi:hypothetical protein